MLTMLRRMFWLALIGGAGYAGWMAWQSRSSDEPAPAPEWPPLDPPEPAPVAPTSETTGTTATDTGSAKWVEPIDGACPDGYPVKVKLSSGIFHVPGGRFHERTVPDRCYADPADAEVDGYRRAKA